MDYNKLLDVAVELGSRLAKNGAETFRVEESINRIFQAYGISAQTFHIPNCLHVFIETPAGEHLSRMRRIGFHSNNIDVVEQYSNLSRRICAEQPDDTLAMQWLHEAQSKVKHYSWLMQALGCFGIGVGFSILFGGSLTDCICSGICGITIGFVSAAMNRLEVNPFFTTIIASFIMALVAYTFDHVHFTVNTDAVIIGALMILVPGLLYTNAMRDIIYGDTNSGLNRVVQVLLIAAAIALGTGAALSVTDALWGTYIPGTALSHHLATESVASLICCIGFIIVFNIHGNGAILCALGGVLSWVTYRLVSTATGSDISGYFWAMIIASLYAEVMARIRKFPAFSYLVISAMPLLPGAGVYYTMNYAVRGDMRLFASEGIHTAEIAGIMAVGILLGSTLVRIISVSTKKKHG